MSGRRAQTKRGRGRPRARDGRARPPPLMQCFTERCVEVLEKLKRKDHYDIFLNPVDTNEVKGYDTIIKTPMCISIIAKKLEEGRYKSLGEFRRDLDLIWSNCLLFNGKEPDNVFTKKALELQKVTERLMTSTRIELEKDKEELNRWKERHRRNKPPASESALTDAAHDALLSTSTDIPASAAPNSTTGAQPTPAAAPRADPRVAFERALREMLRTQYSSNSGLHKRPLSESIPDHYIAPDGNAVRIPKVTHDPFMANRWDEYTDIKSRPDIQLPDALFHKIPPFQRNMCSPLERQEYVNVKAYIDSLQSFVKDSGEIPSRIISEFLGPELAIRDTMEKRKKRKLEGGAAAISSEPLKAGSEGANANKTTDPLVSAGRFSMLNNPPRVPPELDGEDSLHKFMSPELVEQVRNVPISVIDFAMPYGVRAESLNEILHMTQTGALRLDPAHVKSLEDIRKSTTDFAVRQDPRAIAAMGGASTFSASQIHDFQLKLTQQIEALAKMMPDRKTISQQPTHNAQPNMNRPQIGNQLPPIVPTGSHVGLPGEHQNPLTARRLQDQNAKSRSRARNSVVSYQTRNASPLQQPPLDPTANGLRGRPGTAGALSNVLGNAGPLNPLGNLAPLQNTRHVPAQPGNIPPHLVAGAVSKSRPMNMVDGALNNHSLLGPSLSAQHMRVHEAHRPKSLPMPNRMQPGGLPNLTSAQNGMVPGMHAQLMNPSRSAASQLRALPNQMVSQGNNANAAARLASIIQTPSRRAPSERAGTQEGGHQKVTKNIDSFGKQLTGLLSNDPVQRQQQINAHAHSQVRNAPNFAQLQVLNQAAPTSTQQQALNSLVNGGGTLPRNLQAIRSHSQPQQNHFNPDARHQLLGYGPNAQQAGMTTARASSAELAQSAPFQAHGGPASIPGGSLQPQSGQVSLAGAGDLAPLFGSSEHRASGNMASMNLFDNGRESKQAANTGGTGNASANVPASGLGDLFNFDSAALSDGNQAPDFGF